jgi:hypothetical protein
MPQIKETKARTIYDLDAWELFEVRPSIVMIISDKNGKVRTIKPCQKVSFMPVDLVQDSRDFYEIISFEQWIKGFNKHHSDVFNIKLECKDMKDVQQFYAKVGATFW